MQHIECVGVNTYEALPGTSLYQATLEILSVKRTQKVYLLFNGIEILVNTDSCRDDLVEKYGLQLSIRHLSK